jgi:hypothetical protein
MFVQVITAHTTDPAGLRHQGERWSEDVRPAAEGFLGATIGTANDGTTIALIRFKDEVAARANADRREQRAWLDDTAKYYDLEPTFRESSDVEVLFDGGSDAAGFVQVIEGRVRDRVRLVELMTPALLDQLRAARPDIIGGTRVWFPEGTFLEVVYFTGDGDARQGEASSEFSEAHKELEALYDVTRYTDIHEPTLLSPPD